MNIPLNINFQQILLHLLNFAILAGGLYLLLYKPVKKFMEQRTAHYQELEDEAQAKLRRAEELNQKYEALMNESGEAIRQERAKAQQSIQATADQRLAEAEQQAAAMIADANRAAQHSREKILKDTQKELQELAVSATEKLVLQSGGDAFDQFLDAAERGTGHEHP